LETEDCPQKRTAGAPRAELFCNEEAREQFHAFVGRVMKEVYQEKYHGYVVGQQVAYRVEGAAMMFLVLTEKGLINKDRTVHSFCKELTKCVTSLGYPPTVIPNRCHVGPKINEYTHAQEKRIIITGELSEKTSPSHQECYTFLHRFYELLCEKL